MKKTVVPTPLNTQNEVLATKQHRSEQERMLQLQEMSKARSLCEARFRMLFDLVPVAAYTCDAQGVIQEYNQQAVELWGRIPAQRDMSERFCGSLQIFYPDGREMPHEAWPMARTLRNETLLLAEREILIERPDGKCRRVIAHPQLLRNEAGEIIEGINFLHDITERKQLEAEREESLKREQYARDEAITANRAKDEFLAMVSHELRAPLNAVLGWAKILRGGKYQPDTLVHALEVIERSARSQQRLIEDLLDSSRILSGKLRLEMQPVDLTAMIDVALDTFRATAEAKQVTLTTKYKGENMIVTGDPERLQQVIWNLASNAVKFTPSGGNVTLALERIDPYLQLTVSDTGKGIDREFLPHVFDRFHQADSSSHRQSGLGLGLALVQQLVEMHGGTVSARSAGEGQGTSFTVKLPLRAVRPSSTANDIVPLHEPKRETSQVLLGLRILVVDDESDARELIAMMLEHQGAHVTTADSAAAAFFLLSKAVTGAFDCLVSDIGMPGGDGYELIRRVRETEQDTTLPAIALTAFGRAKDRIAALSAGFQMHISKPVEPRELAMVIAGVTGRAGKVVSAG